MKKLFYNIYSNLSDEEFRQIESGLIALEQKITLSLEGSSWQMTLPVSSNDALFVDFITEGKVMSGNLGIHYIDKPGNACFSFYLTKGFDNKTHRFFFRAILVESESLEFFAENIIQIVERALDLYRSWDRKFIEDNGLKIEFT